MIAWHVFALCAFLSVMWGIYLAFTIVDYRTTLATAARRRSDIVSAFRRMVVAFCLFFLPFAFVVRTFCVLVGVGDEAAAQVTFFAFVGPNVLGSIYAVVSLRYD